MPADGMKLAGLLDALRGGSRAVREDRDAARQLTAMWPRAPKMIAWYDRCVSWAAERAVTGGATAVVLGGTGFPFGDAPHQAAANAGPARFYYAGTLPVLARLRDRALEGDDRAEHVDVSICDPAALLDAIRERGAGPGPYQVQLGFALGFLDSDGAAAAVAQYGKLLPPGSQLVIAVPAGDEGRRMAVLGGMIPHAPADVEAWCEAAGLDLSGGRLIDVRAWGREELAAGELREAGGRILAAIARVR